MSSRRSRISVSLMVLSASLSAAQTCSTPGEMLSVQATPAQRWTQQRDAALEARRVPVGSGNRYFVYGDEIRLSRDVPTLLSKGPNCATNVPGVVIEARVLIVDGQLCLQDGSLALRAQTIVFENGWIRLGQPPTQTVQTVELTASVLDLRRAPRTFLRFATRDWFGGTWPASAQTARSVSLTAGTIQGATVASADALTWLRSRTLDAGYTAADAYWQGVYGAHLGTEGKAAWTAAAVSQHRWPQQSFDRIAGTYYAAPYDPAVQAFTLQRLQALDVLSQNRSNPVYPQTQRLRDQIRRRVDAFDMPAGATPMLNVDQLIDDLISKVDVSLPANGTGLLDVWDHNWVASLQTGKPDLTAIAVTRTALDEKWKQSDAADREIGTIQTELKRKQDQLHNIQLQVDGRLERLRQDWEDKKKSTKDIDGVLKTAQTVTVVAGALYPPAAPVAATLSQGLDILATSNCNRLAGKTTGDAAFQAIADASKRRAELNAALKEASDAYTRQNQAKAGARRYLSGRSGSDAEKAADKKAYGNFTQGVSDWGAAGAKAVGTLSKDSCTKDAAPPDFSGDQALQEFLAQIEAGRAEEAGIITRLLVKQREQVNRNQEILQFETTLNDLQTLDLVNEAGRLRLLGLSNGVRDLLYRDLLLAAAKLRRALLATGIRAADLPDAVQEIMATPDAFQVQVDSDDWTRPAAEWEQRLGDRRRELRNRLLTFVNDARRILQDAKTRVVNGKIVPNQFVARMDAAGPNGPERRAFLEALNHALRDVYVQGGKGVLQHHAPIRIPLPVVPTDRPQYFVDAVVRKVEYTQALPGQDWPETAFEVWNSGVGRLTFDAGGRCLALFSDGTTPKESFPTAIRGPAVNLWSDRVQSIAESADLLKRAYPYDAQYYLTVSLPDPGDWPAAPQVRNITIDFVKRGPR